MSQQVRTRPKQDWQLFRDYHDREGAHTHNMVTAPEDPRRWSPRGSRVETELSSEEVFEGRFEKRQKLTGQSPEAKQKERGGVFRILCEENRMGLHMEAGPAERLQTSRL